MPSRIALVHTAEGSSVNKGQRLIVKEAMKMELVLTAPFGGVVKTIKVKAGDQVAEGALLAVVAKENDGMAISMLSDRIEDEIRRTVTETDNLPFATMTHNPHMTRFSLALLKHGSTEVAR